MQLVYHVPLTHSLVHYTLVFYFVCTRGTKEDSDQVVLNDCIQLVYHQSCRHHLILVYIREILILDLEINQTVGIIPLERAGSPFVQVRGDRAGLGWGNHSTVEDRVTLCTGERNVTMIW